MTECCAFLLFLARYFVMRRETVSGMPEAAAVASMGKDGQRRLVQPHALRAEGARQDDAVREPENFSATENAVT